VRAYIVAGGAGVGKSTLGRALAASTGAVLLDLDTLTNGLLDRMLAPSGLPGHWNDERHRDWVRPARYAALLDVAAEQLSLGHDVVLVAPFSAELRGGAEWETLSAALSPPAALRVVWLDASEEVRSSRVRDRGELRDGAVGALRAAVTPSIPHVAVDATMSTDDQVATVMKASTTGC
jgi:sugar-phosphatase